MTYKQFRGIIEAAVVEMYEREYSLNGDLFATEHEMENMRKDPLEYTGVLSRDAQRLLENIFGAQRDLFDTLNAALNVK